MAINNNERYCYRVEPRTIVPGKKVQTGNTATSNLPVFEEQTGVFIVVEGRTEQYIDRHGNKIPRQDGIRTDNYFDSDKVAAETAKALHQKMGCDSTGCSWTESQEG